MEIKRLAFTDKHVCAVETATLDETPPEGAVLVRNLHTLISPGTELAMFRKIHRDFQDPNSDYARYPFYPGYSAVGEVIASTCGEDGPQAGDLVCYKGKHSTCAVSDELAQCHKLPAKRTAPPEAFCFAVLLRTALTVIHVAPVKPGTNVVVVGMGIVGNLAAQLYRLMGAGVVAGADLSPRRLAMAQEMGAIDLAFNVQEKPLAEWVPDLGVHGAEVVVEAVGISSTIQDSMKAVTPGGRVVLLGSPRTPVEIDPYDDIHSPGVHVIGAHISSVDPAARARDASLLVRLLAEETVKVMPLITHRLTLDDAQTAYEGLRDQPDQYTGVLFDYE